MLPDDDMIDAVVKLEEDIGDSDEDKMGVVEVAVLESGMVGSLAAIIHIDSDSTDKESKKSVL
jgi:hypothetical protein